MKTKIEFVVRDDHDIKPGGDVVQARKYTELMKARGFDVTYTVGKPIGYGICHVFSVDRPIEFLRASDACQGRPLVVSAIHHSRHHVQAFRFVRRGLLGLAERRVSEPLVEVTKDRLRLARAAPVRTLTAAPVWPSNSRIRDALYSATSVQVLAHGEARWLAQDFDYRGLVIRVPNGTDLDEPDAVSIQPIGRDIDVIVVGRIEERKNQLAIARCLSGFSDLRVAFLGHANEVSRQYVSEFKAVVQASENLEWLGSVPHSAVRGYLARSRISLSASYFEVLALGDLEAAQAGCLVIASQNGNTKEFLQDGALYLDPWRVEDDLRELLSQVDLLRGRRKKSELPSWQEVGDLLEAEYERIAGN